MHADDREFEDFVCEVEPRLRRAFLGSRGVDGAADAVSEATAYAWEHWQDVRVMETPTGYLYRVGQSRTRTRKVAALPQPEAVGLPDIEPALIPALLALPETQRTAVFGHQERSRRQFPRAGSSVTRGRTTTRRHGVVQRWIQHEVRRRQFRDLRMQAHGTRSLDFPLRRRIRRRAPLTRGG